MFCKNNSKKSLDAILLQTRNYSKKSAKALNTPVLRNFNDDNYVISEYSPNWELFSPRGNRFYFPNGIGPAWQGATTTIHVEVPLENLVDLSDNVDKTLLQVNVNKCPQIMKKGLGEIFPASEVISSEFLTLLTLKCTAEESDDSEKNASNFVLAAREITARLRLHGFWSDFINPFSGKPFYTWTSGKKSPMESRFKGLGIELEKVNECTVIKPAPSNVFSACIFTTAPSDEKTLKQLLEE